MRMGKHATIKLWHHGLIRPGELLVSLAAVFWAVTQRSTQKKRLLTSELHSFLIVLAVCLRSFQQTNHVKMGLTDLRDSRCVSVVLIKAFLVLHSSL